jgi:hypothetical protein
MEIGLWVIEAIIVIVVGFILAILICWLYNEYNKSDWDK